MDILFLPENPLLIRDSVSQSRATSARVTMLLQWMRDQANALAREPPRIIASRFYGAKTRSVQLQVRRNILGDPLLSHHHNVETDL